MGFASSFRVIFITPKSQLEDRSKTTFTTKWSCFQYTVMPFGLKNVPAIFSRVVVTAFKEYIHKFLEIYLDDWTVFGLVKHEYRELTFDAGYMLTTPDCVESIKVHLPPPLWKATRPCGLQKRPDGAPCEDYHYSQSGSTAKCQTTTHHFGAHWLL